MSEAHPIEGQIILLAGAQASVNLAVLPDLVERVQAHINTHIEEYDRTYERIDGSRGTSYYLTESGYWETLGDELDLHDREVDAVRRAHTEQFRRDGRRLDREEEFETTIEIRDVVAVDSTLP